MIIRSDCHQVPCRVNEISTGWSLVSFLFCLLVNVNNFWSDWFLFVQLDREEEDSEVEDEEDPDFYQMAHMPI